MPKMQPRRPISTQDKPQFCLPFTAYSFRIENDFIMVGTTISYLPPAMRRM
jgi:hypothetical protein